MPSGIKPGFIAKLTFDEVATKATAPTRDAAILFPNPMLAFIELPDVKNGESLLLMTP